MGEPRGEPLPESVQAADADGHDIVLGKHLGHRRRVDGDEVFDPSGWGGITQVLAGRRRLSAGDLRSLVRATAPGGLGRLLYRRSLSRPGALEYPWLREDARERLVIVHEHSGVDELEERISDSLSWDDEDAAQAIHDAASAARGETTGREAFALMNATLPESTRFEKVGELTDPVGADVYLEPPEDDELAAAA